MQLDWEKRATSAKSQTKVKRTEWKKIQEDAKFIDDQKEIIELKKETDSKHQKILERSKSQGSMKIIEMEKDVFDRLYPEPQKFVVNQTRALVKRP